MMKWEIHETELLKFLTQNALCVGIWVTHELSVAGPLEFDLITSAVYYFIWRFIEISWFWEE